MSNNKFSVIYFSIFTPEIFQTEIKNGAIKTKKTGKNFYNFKTTNNILIKKLKSNSSANIRPLPFKTLGNITKKKSLFRNFITIKNNKKNKTKSKYIVGNNFGRPRSAEPYKQYILEKREIEENRKRREIENKYFFESKKQHEFNTLKYEGYDLSD